MKTATPPPGRAPTEGDRGLLTFAMGVELAARDLFRLARANQTQSQGGGNGQQGAKKEPDMIAVADNNHDQYADVLGGLLGVSQSGVRDESVFNRWRSAFTSGDQATVGQAAFELETAIVATYERMLGRLEGLDGLERIASMVVVEAAHSTVFADIAGNDLEALLAPSGQPLSPSGTAGSTS